MSHDATTEARARLDLATRAPLVRTRDRRVHAVALAAMGVVLGLYAVLSSSTLVTAGFFVAMGALGWWQTRTPTVPRHSRKTGNTGVVGSLIAFMVVLSVVNGVAASRGDDAPVWLRVVLALVVAAPLLLSAALVARGPRDAR